MIPPDFATFWAQAAQQGFKPKIVTIGKALLFPSVDRGARRPRRRPDVGNLVVAEPSLRLEPDRRTAPRRWPTATPPRPAARGRSRSASRHALFEVVADVVKRAADLDDAASIVEAIRATNLKTIVGPVDWSKGPVKNVSKTPLVAGQWQKKDGKFELVITTNTQAPEIPVGGELILLLVLSAAGDVHVARRFTCAEEARTCRSWPSTASASATAPCRSPTTSACRSTRARRSASSGRTAPARRRCST